MASWSPSEPKQPVAFLAQLGRDHRKYGVLPEHYATLRQALHATLRDELAEALDRRRRRGRPAVAEPDHRGDERRR